MNVLNNFTVMNPVKTVFARICMCGCKLLSVSLFLTGGGSCSAFSVSVPCLYFRINYQVWSAEAFKLGQEAAHRGEPCPVQLDTGPCALFWPDSLYLPKEIPGDPGDIRPLTDSEAALLLPLMGGSGRMINVTHFLLDNSCWLASFTEGYWNECNKPGVMGFGRGMKRAELEQLYQSRLFKARLAVSVGVIGWLGMILWNRHSKNSANKLSVYKFN
ncbi:MAG: hypothetical protein LBJ77_03490 [Holosporales bacterium]|jgi:hypothetical protein|nr:hypothetical protein [Holosporales bacterium]